MTHILPLTRPLSDAGDLYRRYTTGELGLDDYLAAIGGDTCMADACLRPAEELYRGKRLCFVCALKRRNVLRRW